MQLTFGEGGFEASTSEASVLLPSMSPISKLGITNPSVSNAYKRPQIDVSIVRDTLNNLEKLRHPHKPSINKILNPHTQIGQ